MGLGINDLVETDASSDETSDSGESTTLSIQNIAYQEMDARPLVHIFARDTERNLHHVEVFGHYPSLYIRADEYHEQVANNPLIERVENGYTSLHGKDLCKIYTKLPSHIYELKDSGLFTETWEADVSYETRFLIDTGLYTALEVDESDKYETYDERHYKIHVSDVSPIDDHESVYVDPRIGTVDIEVAAEDGFPEPEDAASPVTTIVAHDSYTDEYTSWALRASSWDSDVSLPDTRVFDDEQQLLTDFHEYMKSSRFDVITGWNSNGFDYPYLIQRSRNLSVWNYFEWSPLGEVGLSNRNDPRIKGVTALDMLDGYKKTQMGTLKKATLEYIATKELGEGKIQTDVEIPDGENEYTYLWRHEPEAFLEYNYRDVEAVTEIDDQVGVTELFSNLRQLVGCRFESCDPNVTLLDVMFLREADSQDIILPTATAPDTGDFFGAYVFPPEDGLHEHTIYPDLSSLYPNIILQCNISPETIIGTEEKLEESEYTKDDCVYSYIDTQTTPSQKSESDPVYEKCYFLNHETESGFVSDVVEEILSLNEIYAGTELYGASKQIRNSVWGYLGDSDSFGKGTRLFNWRMGEAITLGGRKVIQYSAEEFIDYINETAHPDDSEKAYVFAGDTDSVMTALPFVESSDEAIDIAMDAATHLNESYDSFVKETFGSTHNHMEIEIESYGSGCFFPTDLKDGGGVKKRYAQKIAWDDDDFWLDEPYVSIKGFDYVRGDTAAVTADVQYAVLTTILDDKLSVTEKREQCVTTVRNVVDEIRSGERSLDEYGIPFGIGQSLKEYGSTSRKAFPQYRGAKYANAHIYETNAITEGDKPLYWYVSRVNGEYPRTYTADTREDGQSVDSIAVLEASDLPSEFTVDTETMIEKTIVDPLERIFVAMGWDVGDVLVESDQTDLAAYF